MNNMEKYKVQIEKLGEDRDEFVSSVITNNEGNVLLLKRKATLKLDPGKYDMCSGHIKKGEIPAQAMIRELGEEIGITIEDILDISKLGKIPTPHQKFRDKMCHMYHIKIDLSLDEIEEKIKKVEEPEMESVIYLENVNELRNMLKTSKEIRNIYTEEVEAILETVEKRLENKKEKTKEGNER